MEIEIKNVELGNTTLFIKGKVWHKKGDRNYRHREDGPAAMYEDGVEQWWYYNKSYTNFDWFHEHEKMPLNLYLAYCKWEYKKIHEN